MNFTLQQLPKGPFQGELPSGWSEKAIYHAAGAVFGLNLSKRKLVNGRNQVLISYYYVKRP